MTMKTEDCGDWEESSLRLPTFLTERKVEVHVENDHFDNRKIISIIVQDKGQKKHCIKVIGISELEVLGNKMK